MSETFHDMPCGNCASGCYHEIAVGNGIVMFGGCASRKEALRIAPLCTVDASHICYGARDFIQGADFPLSSDFRAEFEHFANVPAPPIPHNPTEG